MPWCGAIAREVLSQLLGTRSRFALVLHVDEVAEMMPPTSRRRSWRKPLPARPPCWFVERFSPGPSFRVASEFTSIDTRASVGSDDPVPPEGRSQRRLKMSRISDSIPAVSNSGTCASCNFTREIRSGAMSLEVPRRFRCNLLRVHRQLSTLSLKMSRIEPSRETALAIDQGRRLLEVHSSV